MEAVLLEREGPGVAVVTLNRPEVRNALNPQVMAELSGVLDALEADPALRVLILTGAGDRAFAAGADLGALAAMAPGELKAFQRTGQAWVSRLAWSRLVTIAAVNGHAMGGGMEIMLACDLRVMASQARLGLPESRVGLIPAWGGTQRLVRAIGGARAREVMLAARTLAAAEVLALGLVNQVVPGPEVLDAARGLAQKVLDCSPSANAAIKWALQAGTDLPLERALELESAAFDRNFATADREEGIRAFLEKRAPFFTGQG